MRYFDQALLTKKLTNISAPPRTRREVQPESVQTIFTIIPVYLGLFYQGIYDDPNASDALRVFANASEEDLGHVNSILAFWWFWSLDRLDKRELLTDPDVKAGLQNIWLLSDGMQQNLTARLDGTEGGLDFALQTLWTFVQGILKEDPGFVFSIQHLRHAQMAMLRDPEGTLQSLLGTGTR